MNRKSITYAQLSPEDKMHLLLGRLIHAFGRLDFNIGLTLNWLGPYRGVDVKGLLVATTPFLQRFQALERLVLDVYCETNEIAKQDFVGWFDHAKKARALRNDLAHGRWGIEPAGEEKSVRYVFVPLSWELDPDKLVSTMSFTHDELEKVVFEVESLASNFFRLKYKYEHQAKPSLEWERQSKSGT